MSEAIPEENAVPDNCIGTEFDIVIDQINTRFWPHKYVMPDIGADAAAEVPHEMIAAGVVRASEEGIAIDESVETKILAAYAGHQFCGQVLANPRRPHRIKIIENRSVGLVPAIKPLAGAPVDLALDAEAVVH